MKILIWIKPIKVLFYLTLRKKRLPIHCKYKTNYNNLKLFRSQSVIISENKSRRIKDTYLCNPIQILSKEEFQNFKNEQNKSFQVKSQRVNKIFSSQQMKNTVQSNKKEPLIVPPKITNNDFSIFKDAGKDVKSSGKKQFKHVIDNGRVFYY